LPSTQAQYPMRKIRDLQTDEFRVLGALLEKEQATPDHYPLTLNALVAACNQKSNRDPVTRLTASEVGETLENLRRDVLVWRSEGARSVHWSQSISRRLALDDGEKAILTLLLLRGPQTAGELRGRSARLHGFDHPSQVEAALRRMAAGDRELVRQLARQPGQKGNRWMHILGDGSEVAARPAAPPPPVAEPLEAGETLESRVERLERRVEELERNSR